MRSTQNLMTRLYKIEDVSGLIGVCIECTKIRGLLEELLLRRYYRQFLTEPAACNKHHNYPGGLLDHSICVADVVNNIYLQYKLIGVERFNRDIAIAGALLHDVGKLACYKTVVSDDKVSYDRTFIDSHIGHITHGYHLVMSAGEYLNTPTDILEQICHVIVASHGRKEWGSPVEPKTREAFIVHQADMIDAYMAGWENL